MNGKSKLVVICGIILFGIILLATNMQAYSSETKVTYKQLVTQYQQILQMDNKLATCIEECDKALREGFALLAQRNGWSDSKSWDFGRQHSKFCDAAKKLSEAISKRDELVEEYNKASNDFDWDNLQKRKSALPKTLKMFGEYDPLDDLYEVGR
ncbi:MAG: hypothetical protein WCW87_02690 [Candidatus Paceibacterota bacterium]